MNKRYFFVSFSYFRRWGLFPRVGRKGMTTTGACFDVEKSENAVMEKTGVRNVRVIFWCEMSREDFNAMFGCNH